MNFREPGEFGEGATMVDKPRLYKVKPSVWHPGKFVIAKRTPHKNLPEEIRWKLMTTLRFNSIAEAMDALRARLEGLRDHG